MIISRLVSGLGNQLFQYAMGRQLSLNNEVPLKLDTSFYQTQKLRSFRLDHLNIEADIASEKDRQSFLYWQNDPALVAKIYRKAQKLLPRHKRKYLQEERWWQFDPDVQKAGPAVYLNGYWQHYQYYLNLSPDILDELTPRQMSASGKEWLQQIQAAESSVSVHIRRGDYITDKDANSLMGVLSMRYYEQAVDIIASKTNDPTCFIFSDDIEWARANFTSASTQVFVSVDGETADIEELELMRHCNHNIIANSSFSWWGGYLNRNPVKVVIAPREWVVRPEVNERIQLQLPAWIKI